MPENFVSGKKNVLVTGGAGFIGSHLCEKLVKNNHVLCLDNFSTGQESNIDHLIQNPDFKFIKHDITEPIDLEKSREAQMFKIEFQGIQEIYHLACPTSPKEYNKYPIETLLANSYGVKNTLDLAIKYKAKFLFSSTDAVYGEPQPNQEPFKEDYWGYVNHLGPRGCYDEGKRFAETLIVNHRKKFNIDTKIARIANTFGPLMRLDDGRVIPDYINSALKGKPILIHGDQNTVSTFLYISDLIDALTKMMASSEPGPINIGSAEEYRLEDIAKQIIDLAGSKSKTAFEAPPPYTTVQNVPDLTLVKEKLGWFPLVKLEEGLKETIEKMRGAKVIKPLTPFDIVGAPQPKEEEDE
ncbi:GDP-mannose 4,6-dehydratase [Patescibacteria group bacterium]|nr:GDP-mannose 4,6-dehydratase [Patescibacteria group bacterium]MBU4512438.1 GDP-mannose 4,6-dehydratase [Patescibacteria group bacterium]MCG2692566.1 GDP-mannose 4,6-dehydratase [Candidatus Parcubacteria bacterium]